MIIWRRLLSRRTQALTLVFFALVSTLSLFTPFFTQTVSALNADDVLKRAQAWSILNAVVDARGHMVDIISAQEADSCDFFNFGWANDIYVGHHVTGDPNDNGLSSNGASWHAMEGNATAAANALAAVGINGGCRGLLENVLGYTFAGGSNLIKPKNLTPTESIRAALLPDAFFGAKFGDESPGEALTYAMLYYDLTHVCGWQYRNPFVRGDTSQTAEGSRNREAERNGATGLNHDGGHYYTYTYENGTAGENTYFKSGGREDGIRVGSRSGIDGVDASNTGKIDCAGTTANNVGSKLKDFPKYAQAYANLLKPGGQFNPGTCGDKYPGDDAKATELRNACDAGFKNKDNLIFCSITYDRNARPELFDACMYGKTATGGGDVTTPAPGSETTDSTKNTTTCAIDGIGWLLCPILKFMASLADGAYSFIEQFLKVQPFLTTGDTAGIYQGWQVMRNFANVVFVIVFLIIIFSQVTSFGVSNYGIKKMLPRLIVAAVLVNISYWVCAIAIDLSNIAGSSLKSLFDALATNVGQSHNAAATGNEWTDLVLQILGGTVLVGTALFVGLSALVPVLGLALISVLFIFLILVIRQILIVLLVVISPLAFVAYLLPNTEPLFRQWRRLFQTLLLIYPIIGLIFGAAAMASVIIASGAN